MVKTNDSTRTPAGQPPADVHSRRALLGRMAAAAPLAALAGGTALAEAPDPHPAWLAERARLRDWFNGEGSAHLDDAGKEPAALAMDRLDELVCHTPARTLAGCAAQVRFVVEMESEGCSPGEIEMAALVNVLATLDALAGRA